LDTAIGEEGEGTNLVVRVPQTRAVGGSDLGIWGSVVNSPSGVWGGVPAVSDFFRIY